MNEQLPAAGKCVLMLSLIAVRLSGAIFCFSLAGVVWFHIRPAVDAWARAPQQIQEVPAQIVAQVLPVIEAQASALQEKAQAEIQATRRELLAAVRQESTALRGDVMPLAYAALGVVNQTRGDAVRQIEGVRLDLKPTLDNSAAVLKNADDSWNDMYFDVKALVGSATVATTSVARMADDTRAALPKFLALGEEMGKHFTDIAANIDGMTADGHKITSKFTAPRTRAQKAWDIAQTAIFLGARVAVSR